MNRLILFPLAGLSNREKELNQLHDSGDSDGIDSIFKCEAFEFNPKNGNLKTANEEVRLEPIIARLLTYFIANQNRLVSRAELMQHVWQGQIVSDEPINRGISVLRQALDSSQRQRFLKTVPRRGYEAIFPSSSISSVDTLAQTQAPASRAIDQTKEVNKLSFQKAPIIFFIALLSVLSVYLLFYYKSNVSNSNVNKPIIAILPFIDSSENAQYRFIGEGFSDALIGSLSKVEQIQVIARTSSFAKIHRDKSAGEIARALNADYLLEGNVQTRNDNLIIDARLIDVSNETLVWSSEFIQSSSGVFNAQTSISSATISSIVGNMIAQPVDNYMPSYQAYQQVMLGVYQKNIETRSSLQKAIEHFTSAIELDSKYALAYVMLASVINRLNTIDPLLYEYSASDKELYSIDMLLKKALEIEPLLPEALALRGRIALRERQFELAEKLLSESLNVSPSYAVAKADLAQVLFLTNRLDEAIIVAKDALKLDPQSNSLHQLNARILWQSGRSEQALALIEKNIEVNPQASNNFSLLSRWNFQLGKPVEAVLFAAQEWQLEVTNPNKHWRLCISLLQVWHWELADQCAFALLRDYPNYYEARKYQLEYSRSRELVPHMKAQINKSPNSVYFKLQLAHEYNKQQRWQETVDIVSGIYPNLMTKSPSVNDFNIWGARMLGWALININEDAQGKKILGSVLGHIDAARKLQGGGFSSGTDDVYTLAALGRYDEAIQRLEQAINDDWLFYSFDFFRDSGVANLNALPRFIALKAIQQEKVLGFQKQIDSQLNLSFD